MLWNINHTTVNDDIDNDFCTHHYVNNRAYDNNNNDADFAITKDDDAVDNDVR